MTGRSPRCLAGLALVVLVAACGGTGVDTAADQAASAAQHVSGAGEPGHGTTDAGPTKAAPTGVNGAGDGSRGNPGAPGDVAVFEEAGVPFRILKDDAAGKCAGGVCTLQDPVVGAGNPDDVGGVDECVIQKQSDIRYDPPAQGGFFQRGAKVRATVDCTVPDSGSNTSQGAAESQG